MSIFDDDDFVKGRKAIMEFVGVKSWRTVRRWKKLYGLMVMELPNGHPVIMKSLNKKWFLKINIKLEEARKKDPK